VNDELIYCKTDRGFCNERVALRDNVSLLPSGAPLTDKSKIGAMMIFGQSLKRRLPDDVAEKLIKQSDD